jgi:putative glutamine amidotransferase
VTPPRIGISTYRERAAWGVWNLDAAVLPYAYVECVAAAGAVPVLLAPLEDAQQAAARALEAVDALVLSGGPDVDPARYGGQPHPETGAPYPQRDAWELALLSAALERDVPVLGICRGAQLLNVLQGGTLIQHLPDEPGTADHRAGPAAYGTTRVALDPDRLPGRALGPAVDVSCYHHQAIGLLGSGLTVTGHAPDGTIEAVVVAGRAFAVGVQWHPEQDRELRLFTALIKAADRVGQSKKEPAYP